MPSTRVPRSGPTIHIQDELGRTKPAQSRTARTVSKKNEGTAHPIHMSSMRSLSHNTGKQYSTTSNSAPRRIAGKPSTTKGTDRPNLPRAVRPPHPKDRPIDHYTPSRSLSRGDVSHSEIHNWDEFYSEYRAGLQEFDRIAVKLKNAKSAILSKRAGSSSSGLGNKVPSSPTMARPDTPSRHLTPVRAASPAYSLHSPKKGDPRSGFQKKNVSSDLSYSTFLSNNHLSPVSNHSSTGLNANILCNSQFSLSASQRDLIDALQSNASGTIRPDSKSQLNLAQDNQQTAEGILHSSAALHNTAQRNGTLDDNNKDTVANIVFKQPEIQINSTTRSSIRSPVSTQRNPSALFGNLDHTPSTQALNLTPRPQNPKESPPSRETPFSEPSSANTTALSKDQKADKSHIVNQVKAAESAIVRLQTRLAEKNTTISNLAFRARQLEREVRWAKVQGQTTATAAGLDASQRVRVRELESRLARDAEIMERLVHEVNTLREKKMPAQLNHTPSVPLPLKLVDIDLLNQTTRALEECQSMGLDSFRFPHFASSVTDAHYRLRQAGTLAETNPLQFTSVILTSLCNLSKAIGKSLKTEIPQQSVNPQQPTTCEKSVQSIPHLTTSSSVQTPAEVVSTRPDSSIDPIDSPIGANPKLMDRSNPISDTCSLDFSHPKPRKSKSHTALNAKQLGDHPCTPQDLSKILTRFDTRRVGSEVDLLLLRLLNLKGENETLRRGAGKKNLESSLSDKVDCSEATSAVTLNKNEGNHVPEINQLQKAIDELTKRIDSQTHTTATMLTPDKSATTLLSEPHIVMQQLDLVTKTNNALVTKIQVLEQQLMESQRAVSRTDSIKEDFRIPITPFKYTSVNIDTLQAQEHSKMVSEYQQQVSQLAAKVQDLTDQINHRDAELARIRDTCDFNKERQWADEMNVVVMQLCEAVADQQRQSEIQLQQAQSLIEKANSVGQENVIPDKLAVKIRDNVLYTKTLHEKLDRAQEEATCMHAHIADMKANAEQQAAALAKTNARLQHHELELQTAQTQLRTYAEQWTVFNQYAPPGTPAGQFGPILQSLRDQLDQHKHTLDQSLINTEHLTAQLQTFKQQGNEDQAKLNRVAEMLARAERSKHLSVTSLTHKLCLAQNLAHQSQKRLSKVLRGVYLYVASSSNPERILDSVHLHKVSLRDELLKEHLVISGTATPNEISALVEETDNDVHQSSTTDLDLSESSCINSASNSHYFPVVDLLPSSKHGDIAI